MSIIVDLDWEDASRCADFAREAARTQSASEFGQKDGRVRNIDEIAQDTFVGKLGETAVQKFFERRGIKVGLNFKVYPRNVWDKNDFEYKGWMFDVKCRKHAGDFFVISLGKLQFRADSGDLPHFFVITQLINDASIRDLDPPPTRIQVELAGYVDSMILRDGCGRRILEKGECIPGTSVEVSSRSFCIPFSDLNTDWEELLSVRLSEKPWSLAGYIAPGMRNDSPPKVWSDAPFLQWPEGMPDARYSLLLSGSGLEKVHLKSLKALIGRGIKLILFASPRKKVELQKLVNGDPASCRVHDAFDNVPDLAVADGKLTEDERQGLERLAATVPTFNMEQYFVEHASKTGAVIVKASAGTGKTTVMVDRIAYLFASDETLEPEDVAVISFTNKAADSMMEKLRKRFFQMYERTGSVRWFKLTEALSTMQMSTIDKFFHSLLQTEGWRLGFGRTAVIRSFVYEKKKLMNEILEEDFRDLAVAPHVPGRFDVLDEYVLPGYEYVKLAGRIWKGLRSRGYFLNDVETADFGVGAGDRADESEIVNKMLQRLLAEAERRYGEEKRRKNAYGLDDIKAELDKVIAFEGEKLSRKPFRFIFVDEFQDTDNSQIRVLAWLERLMRCQLFVVGDVKQAIYRFRGAEESAFDELKTRLRQNGDCEVHEFVLRKNYRTSPEIIRELNGVFREWGGPSRNLITWESDAEAALSDAGQLKVVQLPIHFWTPFDKKEEAVSKALQADLIEHRAAYGHTCLLARTNKEVNKIAEICAKVGLDCRAKRDGGFYKSLPVLHLQALLGSLLYPEDPRRLWAFLETPYSSRIPDPKKIVDLGGRKEPILEYLLGILEKEGWTAFQKQSRFAVFFPLLEEMLEHFKPAARYRAWVKNDNYKAELYALNLNKVLGVLYSHFAGDYASLYTVYQFLSNKIETDQDEDLVYPELQDEAGDSVIEAMTVHKAKGLEFETVIIPFTIRDFLSSLGQIRMTMEEKDGRLRLGWAYLQDKDKAIKDNKELMLRNTCFEEDETLEDEALCRDEARLLYVALTRAKKNLILMLSKGPLDNNWSGFLSRLNSRRKEQC